MSRRPYHRGMDGPPDSRSNQRNRTRQAILQAATALVQRGKVPSVAEVAEAAAVSRTTAYRYFPTQTALIETLVREIEVPVPHYEATTHDSGDVEDRVAALVTHLV